MDALVWTMSPSQSSAAAHVGVGHAMQGSAIQTRIEGMRGAGVTICEVQKSDTLLQNGSWEEGVDQHFISGNLCLRK